MSRLIATLPLASLLRTGLQLGLGAECQGPATVRGGTWPACTASSGSRLSDTGFYLLQPRGGGWGGEGKSLGLGQVCLLCHPWDPLWEERNVHVAGRPQSKGFRAAFGGLGEAAVFTFAGQDGGMELGGAGRGHGGSGPTSCGLDLGRGGGGEGAGRRPGRAGLQKAMSHLRAGPGQRHAHPPGQPKPEPATLGGGQRGGCVPSICHSGKGQRVCSQPWPPEEWASRGAVGVTEDGVPPGPEATSRAGASLAVAAGS